MKDYEEIADILIRKQDDIYIVRVFKDGILRQEHKGTNIEKILYVVNHLLDKEI